MVSVPDIFLRLFLSGYLWMSVYPLEPDFTPWCSETALCLVQWSATPGNGCMSNIYPCGTGPKSEIRRENRS